MSLRSSIKKPVAKKATDLLLKKQRKARFSRVPAEVWTDAGVNGSDVKVYCAMASTVWQGNICRMSLAEIAELCGTTRQVVLRAIKNLAALGHVRIPSSNKERKSGWYELTSPVFGQKQGKEDVIVSSPRGQRYVSMDHDRHGMPPREEVA